jgi:hypothetical protein
MQNGVVAGRTGHPVYPRVNLTWEHSALGGIVDWIGASPGASRFEPIIRAMLRPLDFGRKILRILVWN